jgi:hypothetical protein
VEAQVPAFISWLHNSYVGTEIRESIWTFPLLEASHVLALALSIGLLVWFDLRLIGWGMTSQPISKVHRQVMPCALVGFVVIFVTGFLLFCSQAEKSYLSPYFRLKVALLVLAGVNALIFEVITIRNIDKWDKHPVPPLPVRFAGLFSLILWSGVIIAGRAMAYAVF